MIALFAKILNIFVFLTILIADGSLSKDLSLEAGPTISSRKLMIPFHLSFVSLLLLFCRLLLFSLNQPINSVSPVCGIFFYIVIPQVSDRVPVEGEGEEGGRRPLHLLPQDCGRIPEEGRR